MSQQIEQMWATLLQAGVVQGQAPEAARLDSPWYVKALLAFSGWLAALFLFGFFSAAFYSLLTNDFATFVFGAAMVGAAYFLLTRPNNEFLEHLALALSLAGQALLVWSIFNITNRTAESVWLLIALLQIFLGIVMPNFVHRVFSSFVAAVAFSVALAYTGESYVSIGFVMCLAAWLWLNELRFVRRVRTIQAIAYGQVLALIPLKLAVLFGFETIVWRSAHRQPEPWGAWWVGEMLPAVVLLYVVWQLLLRYGQVFPGRSAVLALSGTMLLCAVSVEAQGITIGMMVLLLGFANSNRVLLGLGVVSLLLYISSYYYMLDITLLGKAQTLLIIGLVLLAMRWLLLRMMPIIEEDKHVR